MYYEDFLDTVVNDETSVQFKLRQKEVSDDVKRLDKNSDKYIIPFNNSWTDGKYYKKITIENYGSGSYGSRIRNAVTGVRYNFIVGTAEQDLFFKVIDSTGRNGRKEPLMLYYDSPEQYENHHFTTISQEVKQQWFESSKKIQKKLNL